MRIQQHKMSLPPLPTTTLAIVIYRVQRMGQILRHGEKVLQIVWREGGGKHPHGWGMVKKDARRAPGALILPHNPSGRHSVLRRPSAAMAMAMAMGSGSGSGNGQR